MRHYEIVFLVHPDQSDQAPTIITKLSSVVTDSGGTVHRSENIGNRRLAYPIQDQFKAAYALLNIECGQTAIDEIKNSFKFNDSVIRNLVLNTKEAHSDSSALLAQTREDSEKESYEEEKQRKYQEEKALKEKSRMKETARRAAEAEAKQEAEPEPEAASEAPEPEEAEVVSEVENVIEVASEEPETEK